MDVPSRQCAFLERSFMTLRSRLLAGACLAVTLTGCNTGNIGPAERASETRMRDAQAAIERQRTELPAQSMQVIREGDGIYTATSYHFGGAHVVTFDGSVKFINDGISTIDNRVGMTPTDYYSPGRIYNNQWFQTPNWTAESPFGVWGAMGTRSGNDYGIERPVD